MAALSTSSNQRVKVFVRTRPTPNFASESIIINNKAISIHLPISPRRLSRQAKEWNFLVDGILNNSSQDEVYTTCAQKVITDLMNGYNGTILAYGQTGAGKTYTMAGESSQYRLRGIIPRALSQIFQTIRSKDDCTFHVRISCLEIYNENLTDMLVSSSSSSPKKSLSLSEDENGSTIKGLTVRVAEDEEEALNLFFEVERNRLSSERTMNKQCSRSHVIFSVIVECHSLSSANSQFTVSKLNLVDLAGSERLGLNEYTGAEVTETIYINKSLSFLEQVVIALSEKKRIHVPYRHCKLTQVMKGCLGDNCSTVMIANIWGEREHLGNTLATLQFAERVMCISVSLQINTHYNPMGLIKKYERDIKALKEEIAMQDLLHGKTTSKVILTEVQIKSIKEQVKDYVAGRITSIEFNSVREIQMILSEFKEYINSLKTEHQNEVVELRENIGALKVEPSTSMTCDTESTKSSRASKGKFTLSRKGGTGASPSTEGEDYEDHSDKKHEVAVSDGQSFGIGQAPPEMLSKKLPSTGKKTTFSIPKMTVPIESKKKGGKHQSDGNKGGGGDEFCVDDDKKTSQKPSSPPTKNEAFEDFKKMRGREINKIFCQNKELLRKKKKALRDVCLKINEHKYQIDEIRKKLEFKKKGHGYQVTTTDGKLVIDREEYTLLKELQQAKMEYKSQYALLEGLRLDIPYCEEYTQKSRQKLIDEFENWYRIMFLGNRTPPEKPLNDDSASSIAESAESSRFKTLQKAILLQGNESTMAFYYAQKKAEKRDITERRRNSMIKPIKELSLLSH